MDKIIEKESQSNSLSEWMEIPFIFGVGWVTSHHASIYTT